MKVIGITGFKKSGKTSLGVRLSRELVNMGLRVAVIKHAHHDIDLPRTDTSKYREYAHFVAAVSSGDSELILKEKNSLEDMLSLAEGDIILVEGFKKEKTYPKIVCLRDKAEEKDLFDGLEICTASLKEGISDFLISNDDHIRTLAHLAVEKAFRLPDLDCEQCGHKTCYDLAREIVGGRATPEDCLSLTPPISIEIDGKKIPLNNFTDNLFRNTILGMLSGFKGFKKGTIEIRIPGD